MSPVNNTMTEPIIYDDNMTSICGAVEMHIWNAITDIKRGIKHEDGCFKVLYLDFLKSFNVPNLYERVIKTINDHTEIDVQVYDVDGNNVEKDDVLACHFEWTKVDELDVLKISYFPAKKLM